MAVSFWAGAAEADGAIGGGSFRTSWVQAQKKIPAKTAKTYLLGRIIIINHYITLFFMPACHFMANISIQR
ncbi:MAG TPA: hypothetical protein DCL44_00060 [Elusimicrobia bacterium]|nr:hypothetical protein [Elusimicrobiota bacterium]